MSYTATSHCGNEHEQWLKSISFYDDDLDVLENRLTEIVKENNRQEVMTGVEHFQNQFMIQRNNISDLKHNIKKHASNVAADAQIHAGKMDEFFVDEHGNLKSEVDSFEKVMNDLRHEFSLFLAKWM
jgi:hypothetical protein